METAISQHDSTLEISISGKFTFADNAPFRDILQKFKESGTQQAILDFSRLEFIDSAALGMLLLAREEADASNVRLSIKSPTGQPLKMFQVSRFEDLFTIVS